MYYLMLAQSVLRDLWHKSQKAHCDNIKWFKVFAVGAGPRFTKLSSSMQLRVTQLSVTAGHHSHPSSSVPKCFSGNQRSHDWFFELI